jgi:hypothetical protein
VRISPNYVLNDGNPAFTSTYSWGALATAISRDSYSQSLIVSALTSTTCSADATASATIEFSVMDNLPSSVGLSPSSLSSYNPLASTVEIVLSGTVSGFVDLVPGMPYYATSQGILIKGNDYYGKYPTVSFSSTSYVDTSTGEYSKGIITSLDSFVGIAVSTESLLLVKS